MWLYILESFGRKIKAMIITVKKLQELNACQEAIDEFKDKISESIKLVDLIDKMIKEKYHLGWANWLIVRGMSYKQYVSYAIFAAEQVIDIFENAYKNLRIWIKVIKG